MRPRQYSGSRSSVRRRRRSACPTDHHFSAARCAISAESDLPAHVFIAGATGLVGNALLRELAARGGRPRALIRRQASRDTVGQAGADPVEGDLTGESVEWRAHVAGAGLVIHCALPPLAPPVRRRHLRRAAVEAERGLDALLAAADADAVVLVMSCGHVAGGLPLAGAAAALEERARRDGRVRLVRTPWVYGSSGPMSWLVRGLEVGRYRIVGPGDNPWSLLSARDAAAAGLFAARLPPGCYAAAEAEPVTQRAVVEHLCASEGFRVPDHVPPALARFTLGRALAQGLAAPLTIAPSPELLAAGWAPGDDWREGLASATRREGEPAEE
jgi:nucleoside-diphosphate-sugar epimerase